MKDRGNRRRHVRSALSMLALATVLGAFTLPAPAADDPSAARGASLGEVSFANSGSAGAQADFLRGLALLHSFEYPSAAAAFRRAQSADPDFALAYWGEAMTYNHPVWQEQDAAAARAVLSKLGATPEARLAKAPTEREKDYLRAVEVLYGEGSKHARDLRYALATERLHATYPDDVDAACFHALALLGTADAGRDTATYMRAAALMQETFEKNPRHPGAAHYLIHAVDDALHAPLGLRAARAYSAIAPAAAHAQHMPSHIFLALGLWDEAVTANERAIDVVAQRWAARGTSDPAPACGHLWTWLSYGYIQQGRNAEAARMVAACGEEARARPFTSKMGTLADADNSSIASFVAMRTRYLVDTGDWANDVAKLTVAASAVPVADFGTEFVSTYREARYGTLDTATNGLARAERSARWLVSVMDADAIATAHPMRKAIEIELYELRALVTLRRGNVPDAIALLQRAAAEERATPMEFGPPGIDKPANELLGEVLLDLRRPMEARAAFEAALVLAPGRVQALRGLARSARAGGDVEVAESAEGRLAAIARQAPVSR